MTERSKGIGFHLRSCFHSFTVSNAVGTNAVGTNAVGTNAVGTNAVGTNAEAVGPVQVANSINGMDWSHGSPIAVASNDMEQAKDWLKDERTMRSCLIFQWLLRLRRRRICWLPFRR
jgi:hypothetical protein